MANLTTNDATSGLCVNGRVDVLLHGVLDKLQVEEVGNQTLPLLDPGMKVIYYCFLSLRDVYIELVRVLYVVLFLSLDFVPIMLFVYPWRRFEPLEKAMGVNLDKMTCYLLPVVSLFMLLFIIAIEFQLSECEFIEYGSVAMWNVVIRKLDEVLFFISCVGPSVHRSVGRLQVGCSAS